MTLRVTRRLGGYTQWVRLRAPTGKKPHQVQSMSVYTDKEETLRMTHRVTRRLGGYCRGNYPRVYQSRRLRAFAECAPARLRRLPRADCPRTRPTVDAVGCPEVNRSIKTNKRR